MCPGLPDYNEGVQVISCWLPYPIKKSQKLSGYTKRVGRLSGDEKRQLFVVIEKSPLLHTDEWDNCSCYF